MENCKEKSTPMETKCKLNIEDETQISEKRTNWMFNVFNSDHSCVGFVDRRIMDTLEANF